MTMNLEFDHSRLSRTKIRIGSLLKRIHTPETDAIKTETDIDGTWRPHIRNTLF